MNILHALYYGNIDPSDVGRPAGREYHRHMTAGDKARDALEEGLDEKKRALLDEFSERRLWQACLESEQAFSDGFCLGIRLMAAVYESPGSWEK